MIQFLSTETSASTMELIVSLLPMILIILVLFLVVYLPQKRQDKKDAAMRSSIEIGDKVTTIGGIVGIVFGHQRQGRHHCSRDRQRPAPRSASAAPLFPVWKKLDMGDNTLR